MPRIRSVKPEFFRDAELARDHTRDERLFYQGLWIEADDAGRFIANARALLGAVFPYENDVDEAWIERSLMSLCSRKRVVLYTLNGVRYGYLPKFLDHSV